MSSPHAAPRAPRTRVAAVIAAVLAVSSILAMPDSARAGEARPLKIGIIGAGRIGGTLAGLWAKAGHEVLVSVPYAALPQIGRDLAKELAGKIVLDTGNPYPERDGEMALEARRKGTGVASAEFLPGVRLVRAFNAINYKSLKSEAHRTGKPVAIPLAADDAEALRVASRLVRDAGFEPVVVGPLAKARLFDVGTSVYTQLLTADELEARLGL